VTKWGISHTAEKKKKILRLGFSSLKAIFFAQVTFYGKCIQNCRSHTSAHVVGLASTQPGSDIGKLGFLPASMFFFFICILFTLVGITIFQEPDAFPSLDLHVFGPELPGIPGAQSSPELFPGFPWLSDDDGLRIQNETR
jgi:hypothetical protein